MPPRFLFVGGLARSGTSMLRTMLEQHPEIGGLEHETEYLREGQWHQEAYPRPSECGGAGDYPSTYWVPRPSAWARDHLLEAWTPFIKEEKTWTVEKSPPNILLAPFLHGCFEDSRFVFILRHPIATCLALRKWSESSLPDLIENWCILHERWRDAATVPSKVVRYEQLLMDQEAVIHNIQHWLGLDRSQVDFPVDHSSQEQYYQEYIDRYDPTSMGHSFRRMIYNLERRVNAFGYSLTPEALVERGGMHEGAKKEIGKFDPVVHKT